MFVQWGIPPAVRKNEVPAMNSNVDAAQQAYCQPRKPGPTSYDPVHLYKTPNQAELVCDDGGPFREGPGLGGGFFLILEVIRQVCLPCENSSHLKLLTFSVVCYTLIQLLLQKPTFLHCSTVPSSLLSSDLLPCCYFPPTLHVTEAGGGF